MNKEIRTLQIGSCRSIQGDLKEMVRIVAGETPKDRLRTEQWIEARLREQAKKGRK